MKLNRFNYLMTQGVKNGRIVSQEVQEHPASADEIDW